MSDSAKQKREARVRRHRRVRKKVRGTAERPRLAVFRSNQHITAQVIDDDAGRTLAAASTHRGRPARQRRGQRRRRRQKVGELLAERAKAAGIDQGRVRPRWDHVPRPRRRARRRGPRRRTGVLMAHQRNDASAARVAGDQHQPRRQGGQGRSSVLVHRARGDRRRRRPRRARLRQGQGGAARHPEGHRGGPQEPVRRRRWPVRPSPIRSSARWAPVACCSSPQRPVPA